ncbi:MAG: endonuclease/exonuclease/phosphatase family protein [Bdellovibrionales bacterium]
MKNLKLIILVISFQLIGLLSWSANRVTVVTWNVQNLFDSEHDAGKWDFNFLPKAHPLKESGCKETSQPQYLKGCLETDWTREKVLIKYQQIRKMIQSLPKKPDILVLQEIENQRVLRELAQILGYSGWAISHWDDERGVDTGFLFNQRQGLNFIGTKPVAIPLGNNLTRPILQAHFKISSEDAHFYINHWPSTSNPEAQRTLAANQIRRQIDIENRNLRKPIFSIVLGDFNVISTEHPRPFLSILDPSWTHRLIDLDFVSRSSGFSNPPGTYYFSRDKVWNMLDRVMVSSHFFADQGLKIPINRFKIIDTLGAIQSSPAGDQPQKVPHRYNHSSLDPNKAGYSDHYPVYFEIVAP